MRGGHSPCLIDQLHALVALDRRAQLEGGKNDGPVRPKAQSMIAVHLATLRSKSGCNGTCGVVNLLERLSQMDLLFVADRRGGSEILDMQKNSIG